VVDLVAAQLFEQLAQLAVRCGLWSRRETLGRVMRSAEAARAPIGFAALAAPIPGLDVHGARAQARAIADGATLAV